MEPRPDSGDVIARPDVAGMVGELREAIVRLHSGVRVVESPLDLSAEFRGVTFCRITPYRELIHIQIGQDPMWEARLRTAGELPEVTARVVRAFLDVFARGQAGSP
jgi:hypothetical protein